MNNDGVSPKHEDEMKHSGETMHSTPKYTTESIVVESDSIATGAGTGAGAHTGEAITNKIDSATQNLVDENDVHDPENQPSQLPDPNAQRPLQSSPSSDLLDRVNLLLSRVGSRKSFKSLEEMDEMASSFFVIIFERLFGHALSGAIKPPHLKLKSQRINNLRLVIKQLSEWILDNMNAVGAEAGEDMEGQLIGYKTIADIDAEQICTKGGGMEATSKLVDVFLEVIEVVRLLDMEDTGLVDSGVADKLPSPHEQTHTDIQESNRTAVPILPVENAVPRSDAKEPLHRRGLGIDSNPDDDEVEHYMSGSYLPDYYSDDRSSDRSAGALTAEDLSQMGTGQYAKKSRLSHTSTEVESSDRTVLQKVRIPFAASNDSENQDADPELRRSAMYAGVLEALEKNPNLMKSLMRKSRGSNLSSIALRLRREQDEWFRRRKANHELQINQLYSEQTRVRSKAAERHKREVAAKLREERLNNIQMKQFLKDLNRKRVSRQLKRKSQKDLLLKTALRRMMAAEKARVLNQRRERHTVLEQNRRRMAAQREKIDTLYNKQLAIVRDELEHERIKLQRQDKANKELHRQAMAERKRLQQRQLQKVYGQLDELDRIADWDEECDRVQRQLQDALTQRVTRPSSSQLEATLDRRRNKILRRKRRELRDKRLLKAYGPTKKKTTSRMRVNVTF